MGYVNIPNLPDKEVKLAVVDGRISKSMEERFILLGIRVIKTDEYPGLYPAVSFHPDIMLHHVLDELVVCAPGISTALYEALSNEGFKVIKGSSILTRSYPGDISYNVARVGKLAFHNLKYTDPVLRDMLEKAGVELVNVKQGYAKCSIAVIDGESIITSDRGIAGAAESKGVDVLLTSPDENILLPGLDKGFIGGCTGLIARNKLAFSGDFAKIRSYAKVEAFLSRKGIAAVSLSEEQVTDIGSILPLLTV